MAAKLQVAQGYLLDFAGGQGISGGAAEYTDYPQDLDTNFTLIQTTVNAMIDEINSARLADSQVPTDILFSRGAATQGRYTQEAANITRSGDSVIVASGVIYANGRRIEISGQTFDFTGLTNGTYYIATDRTGLLFNSTTAANQEFDLVEVAWDGSLADGDITDNLYNGGRTLTSTDVGYVQAVHLPPEETVTDEFNTSFPHRLDPPIRKVAADGTLGDSGFFVGPDADDDRWFWVSQRAGGAGSGNTVLGGLLTDNGQLLLLEQARVMLVRSTNQSIANSGNIPVEWDTLPTSNSAGVAERFEPENYVSSTDWQSGTGNRDVVIPSDAAFNGSYLFNGLITVDSSDATVFDVRIVQTVGGSQVVSRARVAAAPTTTVIPLSGLYDFVNGDEFQMQITHDATGSLNLTFARLSALLVGAGV